jgi:hypothetical protein
MKDEYGIDLNIAKAPIHSNKKVKMIHATSHPPIHTPEFVTPLKES